MVSAALTRLLLARRLYEDGLQRLQRLEDGRYWYAILGFLEGVTEG